MTPNVTKERGWPKFHVPIFTFDYSHFVPTGLLKAAFRHFKESRRHVAKYHIKR